MSTPEIKQTPEGPSKASRTTELPRRLPIKAVASVVTALYLAACGGQPAEATRVPPPPTETSTPTPTSTSTEHPTATTTATETPTPKPTATATETQVPTETPTSEPTTEPTETATATETQVPTETPTSEPTPEPTETPDLAEEENAVVRIMSPDEDQPETLEDFRRMFNEATISDHSQDGPNAMITILESGVHHPIRIMFLGGATGSDVDRTLHFGEESSELIPGATVRIERSSDAVTVTVVVRDQSQVFSFADVGGKSAELSIGERGRVLTVRVLPE